MFFLFPFFFSFLCLVSTMGRRRTIKLKPCLENRADGVCSGSSEPFALSASNMVYTQRNSTACDTYSSSSSRRLIIKQRQRQTQKRRPVNSRVTCGLPLPVVRLGRQLLFYLLPLFPASLNPPLPCPRHLQHFLSSLLRAQSPSLFFHRHGLLSPCSFLPPSFPFLSPHPLLPSCEIAVVSYGFLFLRDGRWAHVGVEATKHAASAPRARRTSCGCDSCHVHTGALPLSGLLHAGKNRNKKRRSAKPAE